MQICSAKIIAETDKFFYKKYNYKLAEQYRCYCSDHCKN